MSDTAVTETTQTPAPAGDEQVSVTHGGITLTGIGESEAELSKGIQDRKPEQAIDRRTRGQKRFDELTAQREEAKRQADETARERDDWRRKYEEAERSRIQQPAARAQEPSAAPLRQVETPPDVSRPSATRVKPTEDQIGTVYQTYADFVEDLADWKAEQRLAALDFDARIAERIEADRASRTRGEHLDKAWSRARTTYPDFDAVIQQPHMMRNDWPMSVINFIAKQAEPEHIQYALGKDPALAERLRMADPLDAVFEIARLITPAAGAPPASPARAVPVAPPPYQPVGGSNHTAVKSSADIAERDGSFEAYQRQRNKERGVTRR